MMQDWLEESAGIETGCGIDWLECCFFDYDHLGSAAR